MNFKSCIKLLSLFFVSNGLSAQITLTSTPSCQGVGSGAILVEAIEDANDNLLSNFTIEAYFVKDEQNPISNDPNWCYYWSQLPLIQDLLAIEGIYFINKSSCWLESEAFDIELKCTKFENTYNLEMVNDFDWSFDGVDWPSESSRCQGKNW